MLLVELGSSMDKSISLYSDKIVAQGWPKQECGIRKDKYIQLSYLLPEEKYEEEFWIRETSKRIRIQQTDLRSL